MGITYLDEKPKITYLDKKSTKLSSLPEIGQIVGGLAGGIGGSSIGHPFLGSAVGGVSGRILGKEFESQISDLSKNPIKTITDIAKEPIFSPIRRFIQKTPQEKKELGEEIKSASIGEAISAPLGFGLSKIISSTGKAAASGLLGRRIAERGVERGWKHLLDPKFYNNRVAKDIAIKADGFFKKLSNVTGTKVSDLITKKYKGTIIDSSKIKDSILSILPESSDPGDLLEITAPKAHKDLLMKITNNVFNLGNQTTIENLWGLRKEIDKAIFSKSWTPDAMKYLNGLRTALNSPIKQVGADISDAFGKYSLVKTAEGEIGNKFSALKDPTTGEIFSQDLETMMTSLLSEKKDETIRLLKTLDNFLNTDDKVVEQLLDASAAEQLEKGVGLNWIQRLLSGLAGGRKMIPRIGAFVQNPITQGLKTSVGRTIPVGITDIIRPREKK